MSTNGSKNPFTDITAFGEILIDFTYQGKNEKGISLFAQNPGGAPANVASAARRLGARTAFVGKVGGDMHGRFLKEILDSEGIDTRGLVFDKDFFTTLAFVDLNGKGERTFSFARKPGADTRIEIGELCTDLIDGSRIFHIGSLSLTDEPSRSTTLYAVKRAKDKGSIISYDPNYRAALWTDEAAAKREMRSLIPFADIIKISEEETKLLTDTQNPEQAAAILCDKGVRIALVTLGAKGAYLSCREKGGVYASGFACDTVDTTGAGDAFLGAFLFKIAESRKYPQDVTLQEAASFARFANAAASLCVESYGAIPSMPSLDNVNKRLKNTAQKTERE
ncbi:MAG: carbohydrate kinase [Clostridiales bacterium]|nr:carbohydrate kinase [Clostridiales bacterium]